MLTLENLTHGYRDREVLSGVELHVDDGVSALLGVNGAGKSTLLAVAAGASRPRTGSVRVGSHDLYGARSERRQGLVDVALMPQAPSFPGAMTVEEVVTYLTWMRGARARQARSAARDALRRVLLDDRARSRVRTLSGGMLRRVALAQAIASGARHVLLDEPSTGLDPEQRRAMVLLLADLEGAVLLSSHVMEDVRDLASRVLVLDGGRIAFDGTVEALAGLAPTGELARSAEAGFLAVLAGAHPLDPKEV
ncbi:ABC transporter ATP-binding protein [Cellulosimicrobium cellulans]|uniref:ABC transporter ATP-binding protein n=1 Tax=Cellulosimicrobium cellulans TaxID=1710 RepID=UPI00188413C2|nr:ABC transporter ATP-binding protein [Cellulosimicrobium cellulans]MBE9927218.1 ABC transporter ATP-binding protein [Cellulosimicrobium cellulans]